MLARTCVRTYVGACVCMCVRMRSDVFVCVRVLGCACLYTRACAMCAQLNVSDERHAECLTEIGTAADSAFAIGLAAGSGGVAELTHAAAAHGTSAKGTKRSRE